MDDTLSQTPEHRQIPTARVRHKEIRDPYDGLRPWSAITHGAGALLGAWGSIALLIQSWGNWLQCIIFAIYGLSMIGLYAASTLYHCLRVPVAGRLALRKYDHCSIYLLIAGSYTPVCLLVLKGTLGNALMSFIWLFALAGVILTLCKLDIPRWLTSAIYLVMGWLAVIAIAPLSRVMPLAGMVWLFTGGLLYTVGGVLYAVKWPGRHNPRFGCHEIFHLFILAGSICHFVMMYTVIAPL